MQTVITALLLQLFWAAFATAAPVVVETAHDNTWTYGTGGGILGFVVLILDIIVFSTFSFSLFSPRFTFGELRLARSAPLPHFVRLPIGLPSCLEIC
jgi:hypothetical protein